MSGECVELPDNREMPWIKIYPNYCDWVIVHNHPTALEIVLIKGQAELKNEAQVFPMAKCALVRLQGLVQVHNTVQGDQPPPEGTEIWYRHLP